MSYTSKAALKTHKWRKHHSNTIENQIQCPLCAEKVKTHEELVNHAQNAHSRTADEYRIKTLTFADASECEVWRRNEEKENVLQWATTSAKAYEDRKISYLRCNRALPFPAYAFSQGRKSKKIVAYCTAFLKVKQEDAGITATFCNTHCGHPEVPAALRMDKDSESFIVNLLKDGYSVNQVLRRIRMDCRNQQQRTRLYYTTGRDIRWINCERRIGISPYETKWNQEEGMKQTWSRLKSGFMNNLQMTEFQRYVRPFDESGDGFLLVVITPVQVSWLREYSRRGISLDDTFNLTRYSLRLATVIVADEWDMGLPAAYLLSHRMTEDEVFELFAAIKEKIPDFDPKFFMTDDTNSFFNGFKRAFPDSAAVKLLCCFHVLQAIKRNCRSKLGKSHRVEQWGGFGRQNACMNTSMLGERFHKRLKHELPDTKRTMQHDAF
ncbi:hypothetical protein OSTOST_16808 [Ostertagia ostertagi]